MFCTFHCKLVGYVLRVIKTLNDQNTCSIYHRYANNYNITTWNKNDNFKLTFNKSDLRQQT